MSAVRVNALSPTQGLSLGTDCAKPGSDCGRHGENFWPSTGRLRLSPGCTQPLCTEIPRLSWEKGAFPHIHSAYYYDYRDIERDPEQQPLRLESVENSRRSSEVQPLRTPVGWRPQQREALVRLSSIHRLWKNLRQPRTAQAAYTGSHDGAPDVGGRRHDGSRRGRPPADPHARRGPVPLRQNPYRAVCGRRGRRRPLPGGGYR